MNWLFLVLAAGMLGFLFLAFTYVGVLALSFLVGNELGRALMRYDEGTDAW
ncbi:MAG: hypothetical protein ACRDYA_02410 [Egibacteraceae bacterium]